MVMGTQSLTLTPHQLDRMLWIVDQIEEGAPLIALRGLAGTGKTTLIPALREALRAEHTTIPVGTPTHRAAMILRKKGVPDATTVHSLCLTPYFTAMYAAAVYWLGERVECAEMDIDPGELVFGPDDAPPLVLDQLAVLGQPTTPRALYRLQERYNAPTILASIGIHGRHHLIKFGPKRYDNGILIVDEASMVGTELLTLCTQAFKQIILVGDPGQLPPVLDIPVLHTVEGVTLTEIHRQASESKLLRLAYRARDGYQFWRHGVAAYGPDAVEYQAVPASAFLESPLLVWTNRTRTSCTRMIREALGYPADRLVAGEPLVCRSTDQAARVDGFYNNGLWRVVRTAPYDVREVTLLDELSGDERTTLVHLEDVDGDCIELDHLPFRFGYAMTTHTAQGGEWPTVYISAPQLKQLAGRCWREECPDELTRWAYTAITRAREHVGLVMEHRFVKV